MKSGTTTSMATAVVLFALAVGAQASEAPVDANVLDHNCAEANDKNPPGDPNITTECGTEQE